MAGGVDVFGTPGIHSPWITWEELVARDPDVIVVLSDSATPAPPE